MNSKGKGYQACMGRVPSMYGEGRLRENDCKGCVRDGASEMMYSKGDRETGREENERGREGEREGGASGSGVRTGPEQRR